MKTIKLGTLQIKGTPFPVPTEPTLGGDMIGHNRPDIGIVDTVPGMEITWLEIEPGIYICDRNLIHYISWDTLNVAGLVAGKEVTIDGQKYLLRLPTGSDGSEGSYGEGCDNEWDKLMDLCGGEDDTAHWKDIHSWCQETDHNYPDYRAVRGYFFQRNYGHGAERDAYLTVGWRPVLEKQNFDIKVKVDGKSIGQ